MHQTVKGFFFFFLKKTEIPATFPPPPHLFLAKVKCGKQDRRVHPLRPFACVRRGGARVIFTPSLSMDCIRDN